MAGSKKGKKPSAAQKSALAKGRAKAKVAHPAGRQTSKQLASERANLVLARAAQTSPHRTQSASQLAAERANLTKARMAEALAHPAGKQTVSQLAAERANLAKARAREKALGIGWYAHRKHKSHKSHKHGRRGTHAALRPLGTHRISFNGAYKLTIKMPTGVNHKFVQRIAPTGYMTRTAWHSSRTHHFQKRLHVRRKRVMGVKHWHPRKGRLTPR